ncbi:GNAT family N-acetyltransferase [Colwellia sp. MB02u-18]|uniref:GNAT family N-acetyltransferase n=1 Tax=unclassified Colwellia TaxID=196834 RepID=UPI0015F43A2C|nr:MULTISPECIES: GNAT family N-acetyltransferase [unclassified Colwellia]MBA6222885.1 GNAT family N-acetyltransferase [Colwellia sp. MB3u-45]MBA6267824.1 GNAT family N-acetyltransferase [Colwellia sp. MB3u-43]MBA6322369.1 GNAT family N-acetyltransferase [Colwellia sp. MB02u-19]MBA6324368.1 GNAT family N-acetyltransferase [Colwellia sp. MB02u-18]MBA6332524.1 GNAT family N-acetyltransferase [Colwellia sp. MB02u-12]
MNNKSKYRELCNIESTIPLFSQDWWLDAVCGEDSWDVCLVEKGRQIVATMPYYIVKRNFFTFSTQPSMTQTLGPWLKNFDGKYSKKLAQEKDLMQELIAQLPSFDYFSQNWNYQNTNWLPFYWKGYKQTTRYTYVIDLQCGLEDIFKSFESSKKKNIKKSAELVNIVYDITSSDFYNNHKLTLSKQGVDITYSYDLFKKLYDSAYERNSGKTIAAYDKDGNLHAALFVVWDENSAYDLISTIDPEYRTYGAASLLIKEIISFVSDKTKKFDFEGSMIENVERSFRQFGAKQEAYHSINKSNSKIIDMALFFKSLLG